jgi:putative integral membrane protein (TIGR02587 family)
VAEISVAKTSDSGERGQADREFFVGLARAFGGAIFFSLPMLMTMEMWWLGFYMSRWKLALLMVLMIPVLIVLDRFSGFKETSSWLEDALDGMVAYGVGLLASAVVLALFDVVDLGMPAREIIGKISVQAVPASFGAILANSQLADKGEQKQEEREKQQAGYGTEIFFMGVGALFLAFNVAPTEEMILIAFKMSHGHVAVLAVVSLLLMHGFVYSVNFRGSHSAPEGTPWWSMFLRFTVVGYAVALLMSAYVLWTFGRFESTSLEVYVQMAVVLGFPASIGAAAARLIL